jgi:hypothetical protein
MTQQIMEPGKGNDLLSQINEGMKVIDRDGKQVGTVELVSLVEKTPPKGRIEGTPGPEVIPGVREPGGLADAMEDTFDPINELKKESRELLQRRGYIRINGPDLAPANRYILPDQIEEVSGRGVRLRLVESELGLQTGD